jgi:hypothetical protein
MRRPMTSTGSRPATKMDDHLLEDADYRAAGKAPGSRLPGISSALALAWPLTAGGLK